MNWDDYLRRARDPQTPSEELRGIVTHSHSEASDPESLRKKKQVWAAAMRNPNLSREHALWIIDVFGSHWRAWHNEVWDLLDALGQNPALDLMLLEDPTFLRHFPVYDRDKHIPNLWAFLSNQAMGRRLIALTPEQFQRALAVVKTTPFLRNYKPILHVANGEVASSLLFLGKLHGSVMQCGTRQKHDTATKEATFLHVLQRIWQPLAAAYRFETLAGQPKFQELPPGVATLAERFSAWR